MTTLSYAQADATATLLEPQNALKVQVKLTTFASATTTTQVLTVVNAKKGIPKMSKATVFLSQCVKLRAAMSTAAAMASATRRDRELFVTATQASLTTEDNFVAVVQTRLCGTLMSVRRHALGFSLRIFSVTFCLMSCLASSTRPSVSRANRMMMILSTSRTTGRLSGQAGLDSETQSLTSGSSKTTLRAAVTSTVRPVSISSSCPPPPNTVSTLTP